jgi:hypothetical protein
MTQEVKAKAPRRFRFSLGTLLITVTLVACFMGYLQLRQELMGSEAFMGPLRRLEDSLSFDVEILGILSQGTSLVLAATLIYLYRQPRLLWLYVACHTVWFAVTVFGLLANQIDRFGRLASEAMLCVFFLEPTLGIVIAFVTWCLVIARPKVWQALLMTMLLIVSLASEISAMLALNAFAAALGAAIGR